MVAALSPDDLLPIIQDAQQAIVSCDNCALHAGATNHVLGEGTIHAKIVLVGEAPGAEEDRAGLPFQGQAGDMLNDCLKEAGLRREQLFITNAVRCRPTKLSSFGNLVNGTPKTKEIDLCRANLDRELAFLDPLLLVPMGSSALRSLLGPNQAITKLRGEFQEVAIQTRSGLRTVAVLPTFHPASVIYTASNRAFIIEDLLKAKRFSKKGMAKRGTGTEVQVLTEPRAIEDLCAQLSDSESVVVFDTETAGPGPKGGLDHRVNECLCIALCPEPGRAYVIPLRGQLPAEAYDKKTRSYDPYDLPRVFDALNEMRVIGALQALFASDTRFAAQNGKFDLHVLAKLGITVRHYVDDTMLMHALIDEEGAHDLETLRRGYTDVPYYEGWKSDHKLLHAEDAPYCLVPEQTLWQYAGSDVDTTLRALEALRPRLRAEGEAVVQVYEGISIPLNAAIYQIEREGMQVDVARLLKTHALYQQDIQKTEAALEQAAGRPINLKALAQVRKLLYEDLELPVLARTETGEASTKASVIKELAERYPSIPVLKLIARLARQYKLRDTYLCGADGNGGLRRYLDEQGRIHTNFNLTLRTGRLSSSAPNLQNIPRAGKVELDLDSQVEREGAMIRSMFVAPAGMKMVGADFSQLEIRLSAYICREPMLLAELAKSPTEFDYHRLNASVLTGKPQEQVTSEERSLAKNFGFATQYGGGVAAVMRTTGITDPDRAKELLERYASAYPATTRMRQKAARAIEAQGWIANVFGRRRHFPTYATLVKLARLQDKDAWKEKSYQERQAFNFLIQSAGSDIVSLCTIDLVNDAYLKSLGAVCCLTLHDALYFYVPEAQVEAACAYIQQQMERLPEEMLGWRLPVDAHASDHWE